MINSSIYNGQVIHKRFKPKVHYFKYKVFSLLIDLSELEILDKKVSPSSILLLHDLMYGESCPFYHCDLTPCAGSQWNNGGPYRAVAELNHQFWEFSTLPWNNGLTILRKKYSNKYLKK